MAISTTSLRTGETAERRKGARSACHRTTAADETHDGQNDPPERKYRRVTFLKAPDGARIWWTSMGEGEPVILVMGLGYPSDMWFRTTPVLARHYRVLLLDNRGAGRT